MKITPLLFDRLQSLDELWVEEDGEATEHPYYNSIPNKIPPTGGLVDARLKAKLPSVSDIAQVGKPILACRLNGWRVAA